ncbi:MAG: MFS transporter [Ruminococcaceae bacterium]|nr:MFS transporter [Oscillospiraceae bacterium]MBQ9913471.1 MFS transporter [Clostridia bacterium]
MENKLTKRTWLNIIVFSFMGGIAWNLENMYFNTFLFDSIYDGVSKAKLEEWGIMAPTTAISRMVALSAITAVVTTFIMGTLSEKMKKRKVFISVGYIVWGVITASFGFISKENIASLFGLSDDAKILLFTVWAVIIMDMVMTFMGSTSNDSAFNAWTTDVTNPVVRPTVETVLLFVGLFAMLAVMGVGSLCQADVVSYQVFFLGLGIIVSLSGVFGLFALKDPEIKGEKTNSNYWSDLFYGFRPSVVKDNSMLYLALAAICIYNIAIQVFFPYLFVYLGSVIIPGAVFDAKTIVVAVLAVAGLAAGVILLLKASGKNKVNAYIVTIVLFIAGLAILSTSTNIAIVLIGIAPTLIGYVVLQIQLNASVRDYIPEDKVGLFQGIRMIFCVLIPMVVGPWLGDIACRTSNFTIIEYGEEKLVPSTSMFFYAAIVALLIFVPLYLLMGKSENSAKGNKGKFIPAIIVAIVTVIVAAVVVNLLGNGGIAPADVAETTAALVQ